jgi:hypothetical protein
MQKKVDIEDSKLEIIIPADFRKAHPLVRQARDVLKSRSPDNYNRLTPPGRQQCLNIRVSKNSLHRALLIMDAIVHAIIKMGHKIGIGESSWEGTFFEIGNQKVSVSIIEKVDRKERKSTEENRSYMWNKWEYIPTGYLSFRIDEYAPGNLQKAWNDGIHQRLEEQLNEIVRTILATSEALQLRKLQQEEEARRREEDHRKQVELERIRQEEEARKRLLEEQAETWSKSKRLHLFIDACTAELSKNGETVPESPAGRWLLWARTHADSLDPLKNVYLSQLKELQSEFQQGSKSS